MEDVELTIHVETRPGTPWDADIFDGLNERFWASGAPGPALIFDNRAGSYGCTFQVEAADLDAGLETGWRLVGTVLEGTGMSASVFEIYEGGPDAYAAATSPEKPELVDA